MRFFVNVVEKNKLNWQQRKNSVQQAFSFSTMYLIEQFKLLRFRLLQLQGDKRIG